MHQIFREDPGLFARALPKAGITLPEPAAIQLLDTDLTEIKPLERRVDTLLRIDTADSGSYLLAVEIQGRRDPDKLNSWTYYLAHLYAKYEVPPVLLVLCQDKSTASWAAEPIRIGPPAHTSIAVFPLVLGPDNLPAITDPDEAAQDPALAVLCTLTHAKDPALSVILDTLATALLDIGGDTAKDWAEFTEIGLDDPRTRAHWRKLMATYTSRFPGSGTLIEESIIKGRAEGQAEAVLRLLAFREIDVPEAARERITGCTDLETLGTWLDRAVTATSTEELFAEA
ncbi:hypothetical protein [Streptomyces beigongshangae]|uniref:hypothetical protein n=1 Tax=Streptomyces beigongshangae TaxID=2841597 RepID=UPI0027E13DBB|nr:hypothetical protein [Streptomyces sp. REN17]